MSKIKSIQLSDFKFFTKDSEPLQIDKKHVLIYGENGSGKSSIYWALYTLLESANKTPEQIQEYFDKSNDKSLVNIHATDAANSFVKIDLENDTSKTYKISHSDTSIISDTDAKESNIASDFLDYRFLFKVHDFKQSENINLFPLLLNEAMQFITILGSTKNLKDQFYRLKELDKRIGEYRLAKDNFKEDITFFLGTIVTKANEILKDKLSYNIEFTIKNDLDTFNDYKTSVPSFTFKIIDYYGKGEIKKPHTFLNEAKWSAIGLAIRLAILDLRLNEAELKILVLDDLMISLDMSNRDKVLELLFTDYIEKYQIFILTHDRVFFEFVRHFISKKSTETDWKIYEMYVDKTSTIEKPIIIDLIKESKSNYFDKAISYSKAKDFTACAFYLRKECEKLIKERLTDSVTRTYKDGQKFHSLEYLWEQLVYRYDKLKSPKLKSLISEELKEKFNTSKLMFLNAQSHDNLSYPVYEIEVQKAIDLVKEIANLVIPNKMIIATKGMKMLFKHPTQDYTLEFTLKSDFYIDNLDSENAIHYPKCKIDTWQYEGKEFWNIKANEKLADNIITEIIKDKKDTLDKVAKRTSVNEKSLALTTKDFLENVYINGVYALTEIEVYNNLIQEIND